MGFNTTIVIYNDALNEIENDKDFGKNLVDAIMQNISDPPDEKTHIISSGYDAGVVIEQHHSSYDVLVSVGKNTGKIVKR